MSLHLLLVLIQFTELAAQFSSIIIRAGAEVTLSCDNVTAEDAGRYVCRQFDLTTRTDEDHLFFMSVVNVTEQKRSDEVTLSCSVSPCRFCVLTVKWLFMNKDVTENNKDLKTSQSSSSASGDKEEKFSFIPPSSEGKNEPGPGNNEMTTDWWRYIHPVVVFATLIILVVSLIRWRRNKIQGGDVAVAFSTVEAPSSSTGPSADPSSLYANFFLLLLKNRETVRGTNQLFGGNSVLSTCLHCCFMEESPGRVSPWLLGSAEGPVEEEGASTVL
ncbi:unnamed protein product [Pleuronectes platessa]|uniref:Ig-like domain-containing protein n=1 Tax=Pleuronectes platessa TaxID=8262 RepID=A0A9N7UE73_PLEPL|nr:unnamed protein product [Pleuronectes platessa]